MKSEKLVSCNYVWPITTRNKLKAAALFTGMTMNDLSAFAVEVLFECVDSLMKIGVKSTYAEDFIQLLKTAFKESAGSAEINPKV